MATNFPTSLDALNNPSSADTLDNVTTPHAAQHANANDAVEALEAKVGVDGSAVTTSLDYLVKSAEAPGHTHAAAYVAQADDVEPITEADSAALTWHSATTSIGANSYFTIFDLAVATELIGGTINGSASGFRLTIDGVVVATRITARQGADAAGDNFQVVSLPRAKANSSMKLEAHNIATVARTYAWEVVTR